MTNFQIIEETNGRATIIATTKAGNRFYCDWAHVPTLEEVQYAWRTDRRWFNHMN